MSQEHQKTAWDLVWYVPAEGVVIPHVGPAPRVSGLVGRGKVLHEGLTIQLVPPSLHLRVRRVAVQGGPSGFEP